MGLGVLAIGSAELAVDQPTPSLVELLTGRTAVYAGLAAIGMFIAGRIDLRAIYRMRGLYNPIPYLVLLAAGLCVAALFSRWSVAINGSRRWLDLGGGLTFQPSEIAKWTLVAALAWWCARRAGAMRHIGSGLLPPLVLTAVICGLIASQDLGTGALIGVVAIGLLAAGGARLWQLALLLPAGGAAVVGLIAVEPYRLERLTTFLNPWPVADGSGYQPIQMMDAIANGGRGWANGIVKQGYLPAETTDAIFAVIVEELGIAGAGLVVALLLILLWAMFGVIRESRWPFGRLFALGVMMTIGLQAVINLAVVTVVVPTKGIALPFVSSGGTGWIVSAFAAGLVAAVDRINREQAEAAAVEPTPDEAPTKARPAAVQPAISVSASGFDA